MSTRTYNRFRIPGLHAVKRVHPFSLAVDCDGFASQFLKVDAVAYAFHTNLRTLMHEPIAVHAGAHSGLVEKIDCDLFDHASANTTEYMFASVPFDDDVVDAALVEELPKQEAGRAGANYGDLGSHGLTRALWRSSG